MFWKRENTKRIEISSSVNRIPIKSPPPPPKKEYLSMYELLREAESFSGKDDDIEKEMLHILKNVINKYISEPNINKGE